MNQLRTEFLMPDEAALIRHDAASMVADVSLRTTVIYRKHGAGTFDPTTGAETGGDTDYTVGAIRAVVTEREAAVSQGLYQTGDVRFTFDRASLPITPSDEDEIVEGATTYRVKDWNTDPLSVLWNVVARRVG